MHKCPNCGRDFEGDFCPHCGEKWQEDKTCPKCGSKVSGASLYCNRCGYSFNKTPKKKTNFIGWLKSHLKIVIPVIIAVVLIIVLSCSIPACIKAKNNGTYYKVGYNGEIDKETYFILKSGKWTDEEGESGTYKTDGDKIVFYYTFFGETEEIASGTIKDYVINLDGDIYVSEKHKHSYGEWEIFREATITNDGLQVRTCRCGVQETKSIHATGTVGLAYTLINDGTAYSVKGKGTAKDTEIYIPKLYNDLPVVSIEEKAFYELSSLTGITIPDSVTEIGDGAFKGCSGLTSLTVSSGNNTYHSDSNCLIETATKTLILGCKNSNIPTDGSVTSIGDSAFRACSGLTSITIPDSVTSIGDNAFDNCSGLTSITIPDSVTSIDSRAFSYCTGLESITVSSSNAKYHSDGNCLIETATKTLILGCKNSNIPTDGSVTSIGNYAFRGCSGLTTITIPDSVTNIGDSAFYRCTGLTSITIPNSVTLIGDNAFYYCSGLTTITIPDSVTEIGGYAFYYCSGLTTITIPDSVTEIGDSAFYYCTGLTSITIPDSVTEIGGYAFYNCTRLTSITIPDSVTEIGGYAFYNCTRLTSITIPDSVTNIGDSAFYRCTGLTSITIPDSVTNIGDSAFRACVMLTTITIPNSVTEIGDNAFKGCRMLISVTIGNGVTSIGNYAFRECDWLTSINIPDGVTEIGDSAFYYCSRLTSITIPDSVTSIGSSAFSGCRKLTDINFGGTMQQWRNISKGGSWDYNTGVYTVHCTDGDVSK